MTFSGFGEGACEFFEGLEADNSKAYWTDHAELYRTAVREPMEALLAALEPEFGPGSMFRPHRDVRFAKDKSPYKAHAGALARRHATTGLYVQLDADGLYAAAGCYQMAPAQLDRFRRAIDDDVIGGALEKLLVALSDYEIGGDQVLTRPRGWPADHPRIGLLRRKSLFAGVRWQPADWLHGPGAAERVAGAWRELAPLEEWLRQHAAE